MRHEIHVPLDLVWEQADGTTVVADSDSSVTGEIRDIGPLTCRHYSEIVRGAGSVLWTGALGHVPDRRFAEGTIAVAESLSSDERVLLGGDGLLATLSERALIREEFGVLSADGPSRGPLEGRGPSRSGRPAEQSFPTARLARAGAAAPISKVGRKCLRRLRAGTFGPGRSGGRGGDLG